MARGESDKAAAILKSMVDLDPKRPEALVGLGRLFGLKRDIDTSLSYFEQALAMAPDQMDVFSNVIAILVSQKKIDQAQERCDTRLRADNITPLTEAMLFNIKANLYLTAKEFTKAEAFFKKAITSDPQFIQPYLSLASLFKFQSRTDEAISEYKALIDKRPEFAAPENLLATLFDETGELDLAETHYKRALEIDRDFIPALNNLAYLYAQQDKDLNMALDLAQRAKQNSANTPAILDTLGWVYFKKELYDMAIAEFKGAIEKDPENPMFHYHLGLGYNKKWDYANARTALERALEIDKDFKESQKARDILAQLK